MRADWGRAWRRAVPLLLAGALGILLAADAFASSERWLPYPPGVGGPWGGSVRRVVSPGSPQVPTDPLWSVLYAATGGGVYASEDGGLTWSARNEGLESLDVTDIDVCRADPSVLIASTAAHGVHLSGDGGHTWTRVPRTVTQLREKFWRVAVDPTNPLHLFAATFGGSTDVILESFNGGASWTAVAGGTAYFVTRLRFAVTGSVASLYFSTTSGRIFRYGPTGNPGALPAFPSSSANVEIVDFVLPGGDGTVIAAAQGGVGLWIALDGAQTSSSWLERHFQGTPNPEFYEVDAVAWDPLDAARLLYHLNDPLAGTATALYELPLAGTRAALPLPEAGMEFQGIFASPAAEWILEAKAGLFCRDGRAGPFRHCSEGLSAYVAHDLAFAPTGGDVFVAGGGLGSGNGGAYRWDSTVLSWMRMAAGPDDPAGTQFPAASTVLARYQGNDLWIGVEGWGLFRSLDGGATWEDRNLGLGTTAKRELTGLVFSGADPARAVAGTLAGIYTTSDGGANWLASQGLPATTGWTVARDIRSATACFAAGKQGNDGLFFRSPDNGATWEGIFALPCPSTGSPPDTDKVAQWLKAAGGVFAAGETVATLERQATIVIPSPAAGKVTWLKALNSIFAAGEVLARIDGALSSPAAGVLSWLTAVGSSFVPGEVVARVNTGAGLVDVSASEAGTLLTIDRAEGSTVTVGQLIGSFSRPVPFEVSVAEAGKVRSRVTTVVNAGASIGTYAQLVPVQATEAGRLLTLEKNVGTVVNAGDVLAFYAPPTNHFAGMQLRCLDGSQQVPGHVLAGAQFFGVFESFDGGDNWTALGGGATGLPGSGEVLSLAIADEPGDPWMAAVVSRDVYLTLDGGASWRQVNDGLALPRPPPSMDLVYQIRFTPDSSRLVAAVDGRGLWYLDLFPVATLPDAPSGLSALRNPSLTVAGDEVALYRYSLDGDTFSAEAAVSMPLALSGLADGDHTVAVIGGNLAGAWQPEDRATTARWTVDATPPAGTTVVVDGDATATGALGVSLALGATDALAGVTDMRLANEAAPSGAWEPFATSKTWSLSAGDGIKTVYAQFRDAAGNESPAVSDTIFLDTNAPTGTVTIDGGAAEATSIDVAVDLSAADGAGTGVTEMRLSNDGTNWAAWMPFAPATPWTLQPGTGVRSVYAQFRDAVGNASATVSDDILLTTPDLTPPSGTVAIDGDAAFANRLSVTLSLSASDDRGGPVEMCVSNDAGSCAVWEPFAATKAWALLPGDGTKTVYVRFRDDAGNVSAPVSDGITLDTVPPSVAIAAVLTPTNRDVQQIGGTAEAGAVVTVAVDTGGTVGPIARPTPTSWTSSVSGLVLGTNTLTATATDAAGNAAQAQAQIARVANSLPAPIADALALDEDTSGTSQVQPNDPDGLDTHTYAVETSPLHGSASVSATGLVSYSPAADYHGPDAVVVRVTDSLGGSATATVDVSVSPVNDAPSAQAGTLTTAEDTPGSGSLAAVDVDGDPLTFSLVTGPSAGSVSLDPATGSYTYTPLPNASGADGFTFRASDGTADSVAAVTVTVTPVNDPPTASVAPLGIDEDTSGTAQVQVSDPDAGDSHTYAITVPPARGTAGVSAAGLVTYTPAADDHGSYSFTLEVRDAAGAGAMAVVDITVTPVNDAPVLASIGGKAVTEEDSLGFTVSGTDVDGDSLTYTASGLPDGASFDGATATFAWSPAAGQAGSYSVTFTVTDGQAQDSETVSISVAPLSVPPPSSDSGGGGGGGCFLSTLGD